MSNSTILETLRARGEDAKQAARLVRKRSVGAQPFEVHAQALDLEQTVALAACGILESLAVIRGELSAIATGLDDPDRSDLT